MKEIIIIYISLWDKF